MDIAWMFVMVDILGQFHFRCCCRFKKIGLAPTTVSIGLVRRGDTGFTTELENIHGCNVTYLWYTVDVTEIFQMFRAVQELDREHDVDVIVVLNDIGADDHLITTTNVPLIKWGTTPSYTLKNFGKVLTKRAKAMPVQVCPAPSVSHITDPYCFETAVFNEIMRNINNNTSFKTTVTMRGSDVLSVLIIKKLAWKALVIFHETVTEFETARLVDSLSSNGIKVIVYNLDTVRDIVQVLHGVYQRIVPVDSAINFAVLCKFDCLRRLFYTANNFDSENQSTKSLLKLFSRWLVASYDHYGHLSGTLRDCAYDLDNIAVIAFPRLTHEDPEKEFRRALHNSILDYAFGEQLIYETDETLETEGSAVHPNLTQILFADLQKKASTWKSIGRCTALRIDTLMWTAGGRDFNNVGYVSMSGEVVVYADLFPNTKYGYNRRSFRISTLHYEPFVVKRIVDGTPTYGGICMELLHELARTLNFTYNLTEPADQTWGAPGPNLTFNGMIGQLQREEVDIVAADTTIQKEREMVMDFMFPFYYGYSSVLLKKPDPNARKWRTLVDPIRWEVLISIGICLPIASLMAFLLEKFNPFYNDPGNAQIATDTYGLHTFHDAFWYMYGVLLSQGGVYLPESIAGRTFVSCWWLFSIVIVGTYCGNLIAFLTVTKDRPPFETLNEMADMKGSYTWGLQEGTNWEHVFKSQFGNVWLTIGYNNTMGVLASQLERNIGVILKLMYTATSSRSEFRRVGDAITEFNETDPSVFAKDFEVQLAKVKAGQYGWIGDTVVMEVEMAKDCDLMMIKERFLPLKYAFGFTNNSPHVQIFTKQILSIHESGLFQVWKRRWWPKSMDICAGSIIAEAKPIKVIDVQSAFYVAIGGGCIGFCAFVMELCVGRYQRSRRQVQMERNEETTNENDGTPNS